MIPVLQNMPCLTHFKSVRPAHEAPQGDTLEWLARMHADAERKKASSPASFDSAAFEGRMRKLLHRCGCPADKIATRGYELADGIWAPFAETHVYDLDGDPDGAGSHVRTQLYARIVEGAVERLYADEHIAPRDLLHVTCTGYSSPSAAQRLVAKRGWGNQTRVTHAYHMGCYASLPAIRIAAGYLAGQSASDDAARTDIVHNELCTLHMHPADHSPEQLVVQSLFADGHVRYSVVRTDAARKQSARALAVLALREEILPDSSDAMVWAVSDHGMRIALSRDAPARIAASARAFVSDLFAEAGLDFVSDARQAVFAIHPGGPKVIDVMQQALELSDAQVAMSRNVLLRCGNMSSATLPHIWMKLLEAAEIAAGTRIVSLAFGPGLTVSAALMVKQ
jgi:predicted naringenin-chalcone synthase